MDIPVGYGQATLYFTGTSHEHDPAVTWGFDAPNGQSAQDVADVIMSQVQLTDLDSIVETGAVGHLKVKLGPNITGASAESSLVITGTLTPPLSTPQVAMLVRKNTALGGRAGRGRLYWPFLQEGATGGNGVIDSASVTLFQGIFDDLYTRLDTNAVTPVILHGPGAPISSPTPITGFVVDSRVATQRRRLR